MCEDQWQTRAKAFVPEAICRAVGNKVYNERWSEGGVGCSSVHWVICSAVACQCFLGVSVITVIRSSLTTPQRIQFEVLVKWM